MITGVVLPRLVVVFVIVTALAGAQACDKNDPVEPVYETAIRGKVTVIGTSAPIESVEVWISPPGTTMVYTNRSGEYSLSHLSPGSYDLFVMKKYYEIRTQAVEVKKDQTTQASFSIAEVVRDDRFDFCGKFRWHHYYLSRAAWPWSEARLQSTDQGGHMVTITDASEDSLVYEIAKSFGVHVAIGLTDVITEGTWRWVTGEPFEYFNWLPDEPNNAGDEDYVMMHVSTGQWNDYQGTAPTYFVLEIE